MTRRTFHFTQSVRDKFLAKLAVTGNVKSAVDAAGVPGSTIYYHRLNDPVFAHQWRMALLAGYDRIELALIRRALGFKDEPHEDGESGERAGELDVELALKLLSRYKPIVDQATREGVAATFRASRDAAAALLLTKLRTQSRRLGMPTPMAAGAPLLLDGAAADA